MPGSFTVWENLPTPSFLQNFHFFAVTFLLILWQERWEKIICILGLVLGFFVVDWYITCFKQTGTQSSLKRERENVNLKNEKISLMRFSGFFLIKKTGLCQLVV